MSELLAFINGIRASLEIILYVVLEIINVIMKSIQRICGFRMDMHVHAQGFVLYNVYAIFKRFNGIYL